jgi:hypothetical protein
VLGGAIEQRANAFIGVEQASVRFIEPDHFVRNTQGGEVCHQFLGIKQCMGNTMRFSTLSRTGNEFAGWLAEIESAGSQEERLASFGGQLIPEGKCSSHEWDIRW